MTKYLGIGKEYLIEAIALGDRVIPSTSVNGLV
jgi:hypothetical protein